MNTQAPTLPAIPSRGPPGEALASLSCGVVCGDVVISSSIMFASAVNTLPRLLLLHVPVERERRRLALQVVAHVVDRLGHPDAEVARRPGGDGAEAEVMRDVVVVAEEAAERVVQERASGRAVGRIHARAVRRGEAGVVLLD